MNDKNPTDQASEDAVSPAIEDATQEAPASAQTQEVDAPKPSDVPPAREETDWKAQARKWEARAKANAAAANARAQVLATRVTRLWDQTTDPDDIDAGRALLVSQATLETITVAHAQQQDTAAYLEAFIDAEGGSNITVTTPAWRRPRSPPPSP